MQDDGVSSGQIQTLSTSSGGQQESKDTIVRVVEPVGAGKSSLAGYTQCCMSDCLASATVQGGRQDQSLNAILIAALAGMHTA